MSRSLVILNNAIASYARLAVAAASGFFTIPIVLHKLGPTDYGIFSLIAGTVSILLFVNGALTTGAQRHIAFSLGEGKMDEVGKWFSASLLVHLAVAASVLVVGFLSSHWVIYKLLSIPLGRQQASVWIYLLVIILLAVNIVATPYHAFLMARESLVPLSLMAIASSLYLLAGVATLRFLPGDALLWYSGIYISSQLILFAGPMLFCLAKFPECRRLDFGLNREKKIRELLSFSGWNLFGALAVQIRYQGPAILLNRFIGTTANAANGIAMQVNTFASSLSTGLIRATSPAIVKSEAAGDRGMVLLTSNLSSKYGFIFLWLMMGPVVCELRYCLGLWLRDVPPNTEVFATALLIALLIDMLTAGLMASVQAYGRLAAYQIIIGILICSSVPLGYLALRWDMPASSVMWALVAASVFSGVGRVAFVSRTLGLRVSDWWRTVVIPSVVIGTVCSVLMGSMMLLLRTGLERVAVLYLLNSVATLALTWLLAANELERSLLRRHATNSLNLVRSGLLFVSSKRAAFQNPSA